MSTAAAEYQFAAELLAFAAAVAGLLVVALRGRTGGEALVPAPFGGRVALAAGFAAAGAAAAIAGLGVPSGVGAGLVAAVRLAAACSVALGTAKWTGRRPVAVWALRAGALALFAAALGPAGMGGVGPLTVDSLLVASSLLVGVSFAVLSTAAVAARVAVASAGTLVATVLVLSVALVSITASSLQRAELDSVSAQAGLDANATGQTVAGEVFAARLAAADLQGFFATADPDPLVAGGSAAAVGARLAVLRAAYPVGGYAYVGADGAVEASAGLPPGAADGLAATGLADSSPAAGAAAGPGTAAVGSAPAGCGTGGSGTVTVVGAAAWALASSPECLAAGGLRLGAVVAATPLDSEYLVARRRLEPSASLVLATPAAVLATAGRVPASRLSTSLAASVAVRGATARVDGDEVVAVEPLSAPTRPTAGAPTVPAPALVVAEPVPLAAVRQRLLRALTLVGLGGTVLALALAALVGDRITAGLRRLTRAVQRVQGGDTARGAGVGGPDELGVLGGAFDDMVISIEEQKVALRQAAEDESRLRDRLAAIVAGMGDALVAVDPAGRVTEVNPAAATLTGVAPATAIGGPAGGILRLRSEDGAPDLVDRLIDPAAPRELVTTAVLESTTGGEVPVGVTVGGLIGPLGELTGAVVVLRDLRAELQVERMKTEFLSRIGHELRTPLTGILGYSELLDRYGPDLPAGRAAAWYGEILASARRLARIVEMLEFFAGSGAGRVALRHDDVDVAALVRGLVAAWQQRAPEGTTIVARTGRGLRPAGGDDRWLGLAIDELMANAVKFSPSGGQISVSVDAVEDATRRHWVSVAVQDRGIGMTEAERAEAFADFAQGDGSDTRSYGGLGLGLALVRRVADGLGGTVTCVSEPGVGSTFTVVVPAAADPAR